MLKEDSRAAEVSLVQGRLWALSPESVDRFEACRASHRFMSFIGKELVVYKLFLGKPMIKQTLICKDVSLSALEGLKTIWQDGDSYLEIGHTPIEVYEGVFMWHTFMSNVLYQPYKGVYSHRFSMLYQCRHHPRLKVEDVYYIQEKAVYNQEYPL